MNISSIIRFSLLGASSLLLGATLTSQTRAAYSDVVLADNPIAYWKLDETSGSTATNSGSLGSSANASFTGAHTKGAASLAGNSGTSVQFTGGYVSPGNASGINQSGPFTQKTIELWFRANSLLGRQVLYEQGGATRGLSIYLDGANLYIAGWNRANDDGGGSAAPWGNPNPVFVVLPGAVATNTEYHVVLVMNGDPTGTMGTLTGYLNGVTFGQQTGVGRIWNHNPAVIGNAVASIHFHDNNTSTNNRDFDGQIDEVALYNTALTQAQILLHFQAGDQSAGLVGHWKFDEGIGSSAADSTSAANDATLLTGATWVTDCLGRSVVEFDGFSAKAATTSSFSPPATGTVAFWIKSPGPASSRGRLFGVNGNWEARQEPDGTIKFDLGGSPYVGNEVFSTVNAFETKDRWYHVAAVFDESDESFEVWVDGQLDASGTNSVNMVSQSAGILTFGTRTGSSENWEGAMRDFRVYATKLSPSEIAKLYGIMAHWKFDETSGSVAMDSSGRSNDANYVGSPTLGVSGAFPPKTDKAVLLDGVGESINSNKSLLNDVEEFTLAGWFRPSDLSPIRSLFGQNGLIEVGIDTATNQLELWTNQGGAIFAENALIAGKWKHIAAVGTGTSLTLYVDGQEVATGGSSTGTYGSNSATFRIGAGVMETSGDYFDGRVDDVRIYQRALCPGQINELYKGGRSNGMRIIRWMETR